MRVKHQTSNLKLSFVVCRERENPGPITSERRVNIDLAIYTIFRFFRVLVFSENTIFFVVAQKKTHLQAAAIISNNTESKFIQQILKQREL